MPRLLARLLLFGPRFFIAGLVVDVRGFGRLDRFRRSLGGCGRRFSAVASDPSPAASASTSAPFRGTLAFLCVADVGTRRCSRQSGRDASLFSGSRFQRGFERDLRFRGFVLRFWDFVAELIPFGAG